MAPHKFIDRISNGEVVDQYGDGSTSRDYTYIDDIVEGVVRAIDRPYPCQVFNLGKGGGTSLKEFIKIVEGATGKRAKVNVMEEQPGDVRYTCADVRKARHYLGFEAKVGFKEGIERTVEWYEKEKEKEKVKEQEQEQEQEVKVEEKNNKINKNNINYNPHSCATISGATGQALVAEIKKLRESKQPRKKYSEEERLDEERGGDEGRERVFAEEERLDDELRDGLRPSSWKD